MSGNEYLAAQAIIAGCFSGLAIVSYRKFGRRGLMISYAASAAIVFGLGYLDWTSLRSKETPIGVYALAAILTLLAAAVVIWWTRRWSAGPQWLAATVVGLVTLYPALFLGLALS